MFESFSFSSYLVDSNIQEHLKIELKKYKNILVITGKKSLESFYDKLTYAMDGKKHQTIYYGGECSYANVENLVEFSSSKNFDLIVGLGGGKVIDTSKVVAKNLGLPIITIPTIASTCASTSALSVMYDKNGKFHKMEELGFPPSKTFIDLETIIKAPKKYLWAGMGDTLAKFYEVDMKYRYTLKNGIQINYPTKWGREFSPLCRDIVLEFGEVALKSEVINEAFKEVVLAIIVNTGMVSNLVDEDFNGALAHSTCCGLSSIERVEKNHLHGELVAYGILIELLLEKNLDEYKKLLNFYKRVDFPTAITDFITTDEFYNNENQIYSSLCSYVDIPYLLKMGFIIDTKELRNAFLHKEF